MRHMRAERVEIVAELGAVGGLTRAESSSRMAMLVEAAKRAGATAIKVQYYTPESMTLNVRSGVTRSQFFLRSPPWLGIHLWDLYREAQTHIGDIIIAADRAREFGLKFIISIYAPKDLQVVMKLAISEKVPIHAIKIASFELNDVELIRAASELRLPSGHGFPLIMSTGMAERDEIRDAVEAADAAGDITLLYCTSAYPTPIHQANLGALDDLMRRMASYRSDIDIGYSDHTTSIFTPALAVALGAVMIEKHIALDGEGHDESFALRPSQFRQMVQGVRDAEAAFIRADAPELTELRRGLMVVKPIAPGEAFSRDNVRSLRGGGMAPKLLAKIIGSKANRALYVGERLGEWDIEHDAAKETAGAAGTAGSGAASEQGSASATGGGGQTNGAAGGHGAAVPPVQGLPR